MGFSLNVIIFTFIFGFCASKDPFELKDFLENSFASKGWNATWISDNLLLFKSKNGDYMQFNAATNKTNTFIPGKALETFKNASVTLSPDKKFLLIKYEIKPVFRHSTLAKYAIYNVQSKTVSYISRKDDSLQLCFWSPKNNALAYVKDNNIFYLSAIGSGQNQVGRAITNEKDTKSVYIGVTDWIYEEEIFGTDKASWFSPDGKYLAFAIFNDTKVPEFTYPIYKGDQYPEYVTIRYPKVGANNPNVTIFLRELTSTSSKNQGIKVGNIEILKNVRWDNNTYISILTANRIQNENKIHTCKIENTAIKCIQAATMKSSTGWLETTLKPTCGKFSPTVDVVGKNSITKYLGCKNGSIYFSGPTPEKPYEQQIYVSKNATSVECLSCGLKTPEGPCKFTDATFTNDTNYAAFICKGPGPTYIQIKDLKKNTTFLWEGNLEVRKKLENKIFPEIRDVKINLANKMQADVRLLVPKIVGNQTYPLIIHVYGGPNSNQIKETFSIGYQHYLVTKRNYTYGYIDGRGSGRRGNDLMFQIYKKLGTVEIDDQIDVTRELKKKYSFIDPQRVCIWGWSYGGFATAMALTHPKNDVFKCGISVAPVTDFKLYDTIYTERYMGLLKDNAAGYKQTNLTTRVNNLKGKRYFLIHGNADDNVHYQQAMTFARAIELADIPFQLMSYPDENHGLNGVSLHLYHAMDQFWGENFNQSSKSFSKSGQKSFAASPCMILLLLIFINVVLFKFKLKV